VEAARLLVDRGAKVTKKIIDQTQEMVGTEEVAGYLKKILKEQRQAEKEAEAVAEKERNRRVMVARKQQNFRARAPKIRIGP
jgi:hypothetical protein